jgi:hypothetical protein
VGSIAKLVGGGIAEELAFAAGVFSVATHCALTRLTSFATLSRRERVFIL